MTMVTPGQAGIRESLRRLLRLARFESWSLDMIEDEIERLYRGEVTTQPPVAPDQLPGPP